MSLKRQPLVVPRVGKRRGMALIAVLWMVAALSVMVTGLTRSIRSEARMMSLSRQSVEAQALGDGAIQIALQSIVASNQRITQWAQTEIIYRGVSIEVQAIPLNGLIDINSASLPLLAGLFSVAGGLSPDTAQAASQAVVQARETPDARGARQRFEAEEDLLRVPGIDYDLYARLAPLLTADVRGSGPVNPLAAPVVGVQALARYVEAFEQYEHLLQWVAHAVEGLGGLQPLA